MIRKQSVRGAVVAAILLGIACPAILQGSQQEGAKGKLDRIASKGLETKSDTPGKKKDSKPVTVKQITPQEAKTLRETGKHIYLDVRTKGEFATVHVPQTLNIPVFVIDPATKQRALNDKFVEQVQAAIPLEAQIIVGCRSGKRSDVAARMMLDAGYRDVVNMKGGIGGSRTPKGDVLQQGWMTLDYPVHTAKDAKQTCKCGTATKP